MTLHAVSTPVPSPVTYLGYNVIGGSTATGTASTITHVMKKITPVFACYAISLDLYMKGDGSHVGSFFGGIQIDSAGAPGADIVCMGNFGGNGTGGGIVLNFDSSTTPLWRSIPMGCILAAGTSYWLRAAYGGSSTAAATNIYYDSGSDYSVNDNNTWFNPGSTGSAGARSHSLRLAVIPIGSA